MVVAGEDGEGVEKVFRNRCSKLSPGRLYEGIVSVLICAWKKHRIAWRQPHQKRHRDKIYH